MMAETAPTDDLRWVHHESVDSTNDLVLAVARRGEPSGLWITADRQVKGRGRGGRSWASEPGNFHGSHLYVTHRPVGALSLLPLAAGLGVRDAIAEVLARRDGAVSLPREAGEGDHAKHGGGGGSKGAAVATPSTAFGGPPPPSLATGEGPSLALKWPNDLLLGGRKLAGILLESETLPDGRTAVAIGCGINLAHHPADSAYPATHLAEHGAVRAIPEVLPVLARRMAESIDLFERDPAHIVDRWRNAAYGIGGPILVRLPSASFSGIFAGLDRAGRLILEEAGGNRRLISAGEVFFGGPVPAGKELA